MTNYDEVPKYKKKSKKTTKKSNHRHEYKTVIFVSRYKHAKLTTENGFVEDDVYALGSRCVLCGKLDYGAADKERYPDHWLFSFKDKNIIDKYPELEVVRVKDIWKLN